MSRFSMRWMAASAAVALGLVVAGAARATDEIIDPDEQYVVATSYYTIVYEGPKNLLDNSGLSSPLNNGDPVPTAWPTHSTAATDMYWSATEVTPSLTFALPGCYDIDALHYWNFNEPAESHKGGDGPARGFKLVRISASTASVNGPYTMVGIYTLNEAPGTPDYTGDTLSLGQTVRAHFIRMDVLSDWGGEAAGMSELRFLGTDAGIPKPAITDPPVAQSVLVGHDVQIHVGATGAGPLRYQWRKDGAAISAFGAYTSAITDTLTLRHVTALNAGQYDVAIDGECGSVISTPVTLTVSGTLTPADASRALAIAGGLVASTPDDLLKLNIADGAATNSVIDLADATEVMRFAMGR